ncbi:MAG TPA: polysaccharide biosynthesis protein [Candidatus Acidoferrales bacterium]
MNSSFYSLTGKRWLDCGIAAAALLVTAPLMLAAAVAVRVSGRGPVFFRQTRVGRFGRPFQIIKFRTMVSAPDGSGPLITSAGDPRLTRAGTFLRKTKIDEIPQLLNVLRGEMSLVGPRPEVAKFTASYNDRQKAILKVRPGITSPAAIAYVREEEMLAAQDDPEGFYRRTILPAKLEIDLAYCRNIGLASDLAWVFRTLRRLFELRGREDAIATARLPSAAAPEIRTSVSKPISAADRRSTTSPATGKESNGTSMKNRLDLYSRTNQLILDGSVFAFSLLAAYAIRFESWPAGPNRTQFLLWLPILVSLRLATYYFRGNYRMVWKFISLDDALELAKSIAWVSIVLLALRYLLPPQLSVTKWLALPSSIIALEGLLALTGSLGVRAFRRMLYARGRKDATPVARSAKRVLLYGAGRAGILLRRELELNRSFDVIGFIDDDPKKHGSAIIGTRVLGGGKELAQIAESCLIDEVIISMATASRQTLTRILIECRKASVPAKIIPSVREILDGHVPITHLRETRAEELLGREKVRAADFDEAALSVYRGKRILVTGAGGSIGSELVRQLWLMQPAKIAILDKDENSIYELEQELALRPERIQLDPQIANVRDVSRLRSLFAGFLPEVVFHAAAHKHVPLMEKQPCEAVLNNVTGTQNVLDAAAEFKVERLVFISSDKAVNPANVMGATKRVGELMVRNFAQFNSVRSACVRFGNVLGSRGSVLPLFQKQIAAGGPVTITHPDITRYFMTIPEAVQLILCAGALADTGEIFVLDMGTPRSILELAHEMIILSGLEPGKDIQTLITGLRPGEKLFEELVRSEESLQRTQFEKLSMIEPQPLDTQALAANLKDLIDRAELHDPISVCQVLGEMGLGFTPQVSRVRAAAGGA